MNKDNLPLYVRFDDLKNIFFGGSIGRSTIERWEKDRSFPKRIKIGRNAVAWNTQLVQEWFESKSKK